jgi:CRP-like cAMP-binding protein
VSTITPEDSERLVKTLLETHPFPGAGQSALQRVLSRGTYSTVEDGTVLCEEGTPGEDLFFLLSGNISVQRKDAGGTNRTLSHATQPCIFGHMAVIDGSRRSATCTAQGAVEIVTLDRNTINLLLSESTVPGTALRRLMVASLCDQLSSANQFVRHLVEELLVDAAGPTDGGEAPVRKKRSSMDQNMRKLSAKLDGWEPDLSELEEMEKEIEYVVDEDSKRNAEARLKRY